MTKQIITGLALIVIISTLILPAHSQINSKLIQKPIITISGDEQPNPNSKKYTGEFNTEPYTLVHTQQSDNSVLVITDVYTGVTSLYDMVSNSIPQHIEQRVADTIHLVFMQNNTPGLPAANRRCLYLVSTNHGTNWENLGQVPIGISSGFPEISSFSDGRAVIGLHAAVNGLSSHSVIFHDLAPLVGVFIMCDPGLFPGSSIGVWTKLAVTQTNKVVFMASINSSTANPSVYINSLTNPDICTFSGWTGFNDIDNAEQYSLARASNGTIGLAYITRDDIVPANGGDVKFMESTNDGLTWSTPITIWDAQPNPLAFLGALRGVDLVYSGNIPKVVFSLA